MIKTIVKEYKEEIMICDLCDMEIDTNAYLANVLSISYVSSSDGRLNFHVNCTILFSEYIYNSKLVHIIWNLINYPLKNEKA